MTAALGVYEAALSTGDGHLVNRQGRIRALSIPMWAGPAAAADFALLDRCVGPTLDVGCGPGRMTAALLRRGVPALGLDISALAVHMTVQRGGMALRRNVFEPSPGEGRWHHVLLADGNIGIDGDPVRLLRRCRELLAPGGTVLLDLEPPGSGLLVEKVRIERDTQVSGWFRWCWLGVDALPEIAGHAGLSVSRVWVAGMRWQAELVVRS